MRLKTKIPTPRWIEGIGRARRAQLAPWVALACAGLASCGGINLSSVNLAGRGNFTGMVAADEPQAVLVGRDVLDAKGSAADAAVAMAFAMSVTMPSRVSLGAAGTCLAYDQGKNVVEAIDFSPRPVGNPASAIPAMPRGLYLLHAVFGKQRWDQVVGPAESMARAGVPASRAFVRELAGAASVVADDPVARALFQRSDGQPLGEGDTLRNPMLGAVLGRFSTRGVGELYGGRAADLAAAAQRIGAAFSEQNLRSFAPERREPLSVKFGNDVAVFAPPPSATGAMEALAWGYLAGDDAYDDAAAAERPHVLAEVLGRASAERSRWLATGAALDAKRLVATEDRRALFGDTAQVHKPLAGAAPPDADAGAGLIAVDATGSAVACEFSLNNLFGTGRMVPGYGFYLASAASDPGIGPGPMLVYNKNSEEFRYASASTAGIVGAQAMLAVALEAEVEKQPLDAAVAAPRLYASNAPDQVAVEQGGPLAALEKAGHHPVMAALPARVVAARCTSGAMNLDRCAVVADPRGFGLAQAMAKR